MYNCSLCDVLTVIQIVLVQVLLLDCDFPRDQPRQAAGRWASLGQALTSLVLSRSGSGFWVSVDQTLGVAWWGPAQGQHCLDLDIPSIHLATTGPWRSSNRAGRHWSQVFSVTWSGLVWQGTYSNMLTGVQDLGLGPWLGSLARLTLLGPGESLGRAATGKRGP